MTLTTFDHTLIKFLRRISVPMARVSIFIIFVWFGVLKLMGLSPAGELVQHLFQQTIPFLSFNTFYIMFAWFEVLIGVLFIIPKATRIVIPLLILHMITTLLPLILLPGEMWNGFMVLTLEGQYVVKNLVIIALAIGIAAQLHPMKQK